ncbi:dihydropteroate synthase [Zymobacter sp. IVIA_12111.31 C1]|uniref:dihydropteroate synthase n=1 Tax=Zymobacter sp. IVIA_12111.31 C1 TaxID=3394854 RepID=UPI0039C010C0
MPQPTSSFPMASSALVCGRKTLDLSRPHVMGVLNVTPDSFSDGGCYNTVDAALKRAEAMLAEGADIIDVGGESTRPGAAPVTAQEELDRVAPVVERLVDELDALVSLDTSCPVVMTEGARLGAGIINDVRSLTREGALDAAAATSLAVCLMHMTGEPDTMQLSPHYDEPIEAAVARQLAERMHACEIAGIAVDRLILDPGFGFGKTLAHNLRLMQQMDTLQVFRRPLLVGVSRKTMIGQVLDRPLAPLGEGRIMGGLALAVMALERGATIIRTHDVAITRDAMDMFHAVQQA